MPKTFLIADTHFGDAGIIRYEGRPFASAGEMDEALVSNWNRVVSPGDTVYHLGDVGSVDGDDAGLAEIVSGLNGRIVLVRGNHDGLPDAEYLSMGFAEVNNHPIVVDGFWVLSHEPMYANVLSPYAHLFGHVHANPAYRTCSGWHRIVCVERTGYAPIAFDDVKAEVARERARAMGGN